MLATLHDQPFDDPKWVFEIKWDGYRAIAEVDKNGVNLYSRNGLSFLALYPEVENALRKIKTTIVLDGEIVVFNKENKPDFQKLQQFSMNRSLPIFFYVFDCLYYDGESIIHLPLLERKKILKRILPKNAIVKYSDHVAETGKHFFQEAVKMDLEGIIAKRADSLYYSGRRSANWLKIKNHNTQEAIIAGYTAPRRSRQYFGALILAVWSGEKLKYIGHTGTGFTQRILEDVYKKLQRLKRPTSPFAEKVVVNSPVTWVEPVLVCNIKFTEGTQEGILRHPVFQGLRIDKSAREISTLDVPAKGKNTSGTKKNY